MDKWIVNNFIVQMRNSVTQARVHVVNKLVREIRKLKNKKGTDLQKERNCRKAERLKQEILLIKKLGADEISRCALLYTENPSEMLQKGTLSLEERVKVRVAAHKSIEVEVGIFRKKYSDWELKLPPLLVQLGLKNRYKKNKTPDQHDKTEVVQNMKETASDCDSESESEMHIHSDKSNKNESEDDKLTENEDSDHKSNKQMNSPSKTLPKQVKRKKKTGSVAEVRRFADLLESNTDSEDSTQVPSEKDDGLLDSTNVVTDPFFLTGDDSAGSDEDNVSCGDSNRKKQGDNNAQFSFRERNKFGGQMNLKGYNRDYNFERHHKGGQQYSKDQKVPTMNRRQRRMMERAKADMKGVTASAKNYITHPKPFESSIKRNRGYPLDQTEFYNKDPAKAEVLHPSWEAKRKQREQQVVLPFQGKKIKFDDDD